MGWILLTNGAIKACEEATPDPRTVHEFTTIQAGIDYCDEQISDVQNQWEQRYPANPPEFITGFDSLPHEAKRSIEEWNSEVEYHNAELQKWNDLKAELENS